MSCKISKDCNGNQVCEKNKCRENKRDKPIEYYIELCKKKNIPIVFENGKKKGEAKPKDALKRCINQKARTTKSIEIKPKVYAKSASTKISAPEKCKTSKDCSDDQVCDKKVCRPDKRIKEIEYYLGICKEKNIPVRYENGEKKGKIKPIAALKRCIQQKKRTKVIVSAKAKSV
jgi:hypothetical protein